MRTVTMAHFTRLEQTATAIAEIFREGAAAAKEANTKFGVLMSEGQEQRAREVEAGAVAAAHVRLAGAAAQLEIAAVAFLGLARRRAESVADFHTRINVACTDLTTIRATQRANGILFKP